MKLAIVGDIPEGKEGGALRLIKTFVEDHKGGNCVVICSGSLRLMHHADRFAKDAGYPSIIMGNATQLAILNSDKVLLMATPAYSIDDAKELCKKNHKPYMMSKY